MAKYLAPVDLTVNRIVFTFRAKTLAALPDAKAFLEGLLARGSVSAPVASQYVKLVARLKSQGRLRDLSLITHNVERTAANAYRKWRSETYAVRIDSVLKAITTLDRKAITWIRRSSLVPPFEGKRIPRLVLGTAGEIQSIACSSWTLHVPAQPIAPHVDPCSSCMAIELSDEQLAVISEAFEKAWGHRDLWSVPQEAPLFGEPPTETVIIARGVEPAEKAVALANPGAVAGALTSVGAGVTNDVTSFLQRLHEGAEGIYLSRAMCGERLGEVLEAVRASWS